MARYEKSIHSEYDTEEDNLLLEEEDDEDTLFLQEEDDHEDEKEYPFSSKKLNNLSRINKVRSGYSQNVVALSSVDSPTCLNCIYKIGNVQELYCQKLTARREELEVLFVDPTSELALNCTQFEKIIPKTEVEQSIENLQTQLTQARQLIEEQNRKIEALEVICQKQKRSGLLSQLFQKFLGVW